MSTTWQQHQRQAQQALEARDRGDNRWTILVMMLVLKTGLTQDQVELRIVRLAHGEPVA